MAKLSAQEQRDRIAFDFRVCAEMERSCDLLQLEAYRTIEDARARRGRITRPGDGGRAVHYLATYRLKTLCGPGELMDETRIHIDLLANGNYPYTPPASWVVSERMPWTPHFKGGFVVCIGDIWDKGGNSLLGHLVRHFARLLNWDEEERGNGYKGWNGQAIAWHRKHYGTKPLTEGLRYPELPSDIVYGIEPTASQVSVRGRNARRARADDDSLVQVSRGRSR